MVQIGLVGHYSRQLGKVCFRQLFRCTIPPISVFGATRVSAVLDDISPKVKIERLTKSGYKNTSPKPNTESRNYGIFQRKGQTGTLGKVGGGPTIRDLYRLHRIVILISNRV